MTDTIRAGRLHAGHIGQTITATTVDGRPVEAELRQVSHHSGETFITTNPLDFYARPDASPAVEEWPLDPSAEVSLTGEPDLDLDADPPTLWSLYWLTGDRQIVEGPDIATAMNSAGIGAGALASLDFYAKGAEDHGYRWLADSRRWVKEES